MTAFWDTVPCTLVEVNRRIEGAYFLHHQGDEAHDESPEGYRFNFVHI
jgi:hypothetical protein